MAQEEPLLWSSGCHSSSLLLHCPNPHLVPSARAESVEIFIRRAPATQILARHRFCFRNDTPPPHLEKSPGGVYYLLFCKHPKRRTDFSRYSQAGSRPPAPDTSENSSSDIPCQQPSRHSNPNAEVLLGIKAQTAERTIFNTKNTGCTAPVCAFRKKLADREPAASAKTQFHRAVRCHVTGERRAHACSPKRSPTPSLGAAAAAQQADTCSSVCGCPILT